MAKPTARRRTAWATVLALTVGTLTGWALAPAAHAATSTSIMIDGTKPGLVFDGIGAISGGGGNSRLLIDYPEPERSQLLDYLFKPGYGADLQILKIEIGGDTNSTDGAEASIEHTQGSIDCNQGYEWWLAEQAKARNPNIKLYGLAWGAPGWVGAGSNTFYTNNAISYLMDWFGCAAKHNLSIDYLGGWNESYNGWRGNWRTSAIAWFPKLKRALVAHAYSTKVVAADDSWNVADDLAANPGFNAAVDIVGAHYPCGHLGNYTNCPSSTTAQSLGKPLWASENGSEDANTGAAAVARAVNRDYIDGKATSYLNWPVIAALYPNLAYSTDGMSIANQPWTGSYTIGKTTWVTAHTTQFAQPGWRYIDSASGYLGGSKSNGSYVTLKSTNSHDYSTVIETMDATAGQTLNVTIAGGLSTSTVHVWQTNLKSTKSADWFVHSTDITPSGGKYSLTLQPGYVYTVTTTTGQGKGTATSPAPGRLSLPYQDGFETVAASTSPKYFADMNGAFQTAPCAGRAGTCLRQMAPVAPVTWTHEANHMPYTIMGDGIWANYTVSADARLEQPGSIEVLGRIGEVSTNNKGLNAYHLRVSDTGTWSLLKSDAAWNFTTLAGGTIAPLGLNTWHTVSLTMQDATLRASIDGKTVGSATDTAYTNGQAGLAVTGYQTDQFDNFTLTAGNPSGIHLGPIKSAIIGECVDDNAGATANGTHVQIWGCNNTGAQNWFWANGVLHLGDPSGKCMDVTGRSSANGTPIELWDCNGGANQQWAPQADGTLKGVQSGKCLEDPGSSTTNGTQLIIDDCTGASNQKWTLP